MTMKLMYITNDEKTAQIAQESGVDWIFIDLELRGKYERQGHKDTVISRHTLDDIAKIRKVINKSQLLVRVNPMYENSEYEINRSIEDRADIIMLPYFWNTEEVKEFLDIVNGRVKTCILVETTGAVDELGNILALPGIDYVHIGLNDLSICKGNKFMFELLSNGTVEQICSTLKEHNMTYGFGGIASLGKGMLPSEYIIAEHYRLGSTMAILSRSFCNAREIDSEEELRHIFNGGVAKIRAFETSLQSEDEAYFETNREKLKNIVENIISQMG